MGGIVKNHKKIILLLFVIAAILLFIAGGIYWRLHHGIKIEPSKEYEVDEKVVLYRQDDSAWADDELGESGYVMKSSGCLVSCIASAISTGGEVITPKSLNELFSDNNVFDSEGNIQWENIAKIEGYHTEVFDAVSNESIEKCLDAANYPIVRVRMGGMGNFHYILIVGTENGDYVCMDPLQDKLTKLSDYGSRVYAIRCVWYEQPAKIVEEKDSLRDQEKSTAVLPQENRLLYETFLEQEYAGADYLYAYYDFDNDGIQELCIRSEYSNGKSDGYFAECEGGGLQFSYQKEIAEQYIKELDWQRTAELSNETETAEMAHSGIYVYVAQNEFGENKSWYPDEKSFLLNMGVAEKEPFYEYDNDDGSKRLILFYDEETEEGCGIRYYKRTSDIFVSSGAYGFTFKKKEEGIWKLTDTDYLKAVSVNGNTGEEDVSEYEENYEYDSAGRVTHFESTGILTFLEDPEKQYLLIIDYEYDQNGNLKHRIYQHNSWLFGTSFSTWKSYFDSQGRREYEDIYITHGSIDYYYIYADGSRKSDYVLVLDNNLGSWIPEFMEYD